MAELNVSRLRDLLRALFVLRGGDTGPSEVSDEIYPVVVVEGERLEHFRLGRTQLMTWHIQSAQAVGVPSQAQIRNPVGSGSMLVLLRDAVMGNAVVDCTYSRPPLQADLAGGGGGTTLASAADFRYPDFTPSAALLSQQAAALAVVSPLWVRRADPGILRWERLGILVAPGSTLRLYSANLDQFLRWTIQGYERPLEDSER